MKGSKSRRNETTLYSSKRLKHTLGAELTDVVPVAPVGSNEMQFDAMKRTGVRPYQNQLNGNIGICLPQIQHITEDSVILDRNLPRDITLFGTDSRLKSARATFDNFACIIPIHPEIGQRLHGKRLKFSQGLLLHQDKKGLLNELKQNPNDKRRAAEIKRQLSSLPETNEVEAYVYVVDDDQVTREDRTVDRQKLLIQKQNQIKQLRQTITRLQYGYQTQTYPSFDYMDTLTELKQTIRVGIDIYKLEQQALMYLLKNSSTERSDFLQALQTAKTDALALNLLRTEEESPYNGKQRYETFYTAGYLELKQIIENYNPPLLAHERPVYSRASKMGRRSGERDYGNYDESDSPFTDLISNQSSPLVTTLYTYQPFGDDDPPPPPPDQNYFNNRTGPRTDNSQQLKSTLTRLKQNLEVGTEIHKFEQRALMDLLKKYPEEKTNFENNVRHQKEMLANRFQEQISNKRKNKDLGQGSDLQSGGFGTQFLLRQERGNQSNHDIIHTDRNNLRREGTQGNVIPVIVTDPLYYQNLYMNGYDVLIQSFAQPPPSPPQYNQRRKEQKRQQTQQLSAYDSSTSPFTDFISTESLSNLSIIIALHEDSNNNHRRPRPPFHNSTLDKGFFEVLQKLKQSLDMGKRIGQAMQKTLSLLLKKNPKERQGYLQHMQQLLSVLNPRGLDRSRSHRQVDSSHVSAHGNQVYDKISNVINESLRESRSSSQLLKSRHDRQSRQFMDGLKNESCPLSDAIYNEAFPYYQELTKYTVKGENSYNESSNEILRMMGDKFNQIMREYPQIYDKLDRQFQVFLDEGLYRTASQSTHRIEQIIQYVPQIYRVENTYEYSHTSQKYRRRQHHLKILIKVLLTELANIKKNNRINISLKEEVLQMIHKEIAEVVDVEDVLQVFQVVPRIQEVERVIQRVVQSFVEVPHLRDVAMKTEVAVQLTKYEPFEQVVHKQIKIPQIEFLREQILAVAKDIIHQIVAVPTRYEVPVQLIRERAQIEVIRDTQKIIVQRDVVQRVPAQITEKTLFVEKPVECIVQVLPPPRPNNTIERIKEVPVYVDKLVDVRYQVLKSYPEQVIVEKPVYNIEKQIRYIVQPQIKVVTQQVQKLVQIQRVIQVPKQITKRVEVPTYLRQEVVKLVQCQVHVDKPIYRQTVKTIQVDRPVPYLQEVIKEEKCIVENFAFKEVIREVDREIQVPVFTHTESILNIPVYIDRPVILYQNEIIEIEKIINHEVIHEKPINITQEKIIEIREYIQRIKPVQIIRQRIVEKIVQVPKVVQIQRIVERIEVVPRVIDRIVRVPQIVQVIVQKVIEVTKVVEVQRIVQRPVFQERLIEVQRPVHTIQRVQVPHQITYEKVVIDKVTDQIVEIKEIYRDKIVTLKQQVPRDRIVEKIVPCRVQIPKIIEKPEIIICEIERQVPIVREKAIPVPLVLQTPVEIVRIIQREVPFYEKITDMIEVEKRIQKIILDERIKIVQDRVPYPEVQIHQVRVNTPVELLRQVSVPVEVNIERPYQVENKIYEYIPVQVIREKPIYQEKAVEITKLIPKIMEIPRIIEVVNNHFKQIPILYQKLKQIRTIEERIQPGSLHTQQIVEQQIHIEKELICEKLERVVDRVALIEKIVETVSLQNIRDMPIIMYQDRIQQVPVVVHEFIEKIIMMPQIVQIVRYVHQLIEKDVIGAPIGGDAGEKEVNLKKISVNVREQIDIITRNLRTMNDPNSKKNIELLEKFLDELKVLIALPKIHQIISEKFRETIVEKEKFVSLSQDDILGKNYLIEMLIRQLKRLRSTNPHMKLDLSPDIMAIFLESDITSDRNLNERLKKYSTSVQNTFRRQGNWNKPQQKLLNSFLEERFSILESMRSLTQQNSRLNQQNHKLQKEMEDIRGGKQQWNLPANPGWQKEKQQLLNWYKNIQQYFSNNDYENVFRILNQIKLKYNPNGGDLIMKSDSSKDVIRSLTTQITEKTTEIQRLRRTESDHSNCRKQIRRIQDQYEKLKRQHENCYRIQEQYQRLKKQHKNCPIQAQAKLRDLKQKNEILEREIETLRIKVKGSTAMQSPRSGMYSPRQEVDKKSSGHSEYGRNYENYIHASEGSVGVTSSREQIQIKRHQETRRSYVQESSSSRASITRSGETNQMLSPENRLGPQNLRYQPGLQNSSHLNMQPKYQFTQSVYQNERGRQSSVEKPDGRTQKGPK